MTAPSREVVRTIHERDGWWLVASTDDLDIWTYAPPNGGHYLVRVLDCGGVEIARRLVMPKRHVAPTVADILARGSA